MINRKTIIMSLISSVLIIYGFVSNIHFFSVVSFVVTCAWLLLTSDEENIYILIFLLPFAAVFKLAPNTTSLFTVLELVYVVFSFFRHKGKVSKRYITFIFSFLVVIVIADFIGSSFVLLNYLRLFVSLFILYFFSIGYVSCADKKRFIYNLVLHSVIGLLLTSFVGSYASYIPTFSQYVRQVGYDQVITSRFTGLNGDPNYYTISVIMSMLGLFILYSKKMIKESFVIMFGFLSYFGIHTYSKSFLLIFIISLIALLIQLKRDDNKRGIIIYVSSICVLLYLFFSKKVSIDLLFYRFKNTSDFGTLTTGRLYLWVTYIKYIFSSNLAIIFGNGLGTRYLDIGGVHNWYIEMVYYFGLFGSLIYIKCIALPFNYIRKICGNKSRVGSIYILILLALLFFLQMVFCNELPFHLFFVYAIYHYSSYDFKCDNI